MRRSTISRFPDPIAGSLFGREPILRGPRAFSRYLPRNRGLSSRMGFEEEHHKASPAARLSMIIGAALGAWVFVGGFIDLIIHSIR